MSPSPSGAQYEIAHGRYRAVVVGVGGGIRTLTLDGQPVLQGYAVDAVCDGARGQLLLPWPNRIEDASYGFAGHDEQLAITEASSGSAIHGLTRWANWTCADHERDSVTLTHRLHPQPGWPGILDLTVNHRLDTTGLTVTVVAHNVGGIPAPFGAGAHPYLLAGAGPADEWELTLPASTFVSTDERGLPTCRSDVTGTDMDFRAGQPIGAARLDNPFGDLARDDVGRAWAHLRAPASGPTGRRVSLWADAHHRWLQVFTGDHLSDPDRRRSAVAIEPMTCPPNAFRTGEDLATLDPGEEVTIRWGIQST